MRIPMVVGVALILWQPLSVFADGSEKGAKAIFVDSTSGSVVPSKPAVPIKNSAKPKAHKPSQKPPATPVAEVSGLMYYVELVSPKGEVSRVTTDRVFRSGERILLHVVSSIDGDISVWQRTPNGSHARLFPDERIANGNAHIVKGVDTVLPSPTSWFRFDDQPGIEELTLVLNPRNAATAEPQRPSAGNQIALARYDDVASVGGSKGLVVETDKTGSAQGTYVVRRTEGGRAPEQIIVAVKLEHR